MKIIGIFLLAILTLVLCACHQAGKIQTTPVEEKYRYGAKIIADGVLGWEALVEAIGMVPSQLCEGCIVGTQDHMVEWESPFDLTEKATNGDVIIVETRITIRDATGVQVKQFTVDKVGAREPGSTWTGPGWVLYRGIYYVELDCRTDAQRQADQK